MIDLNFQVDEAQPAANAADPQLIFKLRISQSALPQPAVIQSILLRCQIRIEPVRRRYQAEDPEDLWDLFGPPERWGKTMRSMLWTHTQAIVPAFSGSTVVDLPVPCSYDFNAAATKYFAALRQGQVPLCLLMSGTVFYRSDGGLLQVCPISWDKECNFRLGVDVWRAMMDQYYPHTAWLTLDKDVFDRLLKYRTRQGLPTWEQALDRLLSQQQEPAPAGRGLAAPEEVRP